MTRQSISLTTPNEQWLKNQLNIDEFSSKSEAINYLIKQARTQDAYYEFVRNKVNNAEKSGYSKTNKKDLLTKIKKDLNV
jgi:antitoxin ParD1/3/4